MPWQWTPYTVPLLIAAAILIALAFFAWRRRTAPGAAWFTLLMLAAAEWSLAYALELGSIDLQAKVFWARVQYIGIATVPIAWLAFALQYTGRERWLTLRNVLLLALVPLITVLLCWTNQSHHLFYASNRLDVKGKWPAMDPTYGPWFWVHTAYSYLLLALGLFLTIHRIARSSDLHRAQLVAVLAGLVMPWIANVVSLLVMRLALGLHMSLDPTPFAFVLTGLSVAWGLFRFRLLDVVPVAREAIVESMGTGVIVLDGRDRIVDMNPAAGRLVGLPIASAVGQAATQVLPDLPALKEYYRDATATGVEISLGEGSTQRHIELRATPLYDRRSHRAGQLLLLHDLTERARAEEALRQSEERYRAVVEDQTELICRFRPDGTLTFVNQAYCRYFGKERAELIGDTFEPLTRKEGRDKVEQLLASLERDSPVGTVEHRVTLPGGEIRWQRWTNQAIFGQDGRLVEFQSAGRDITEQRETEKQLQVLGQIVEQMNEAAILADDTSRIRYVNRAFSDLYGYTEEEVLDQRVQMIFAGPEGEREALEQETREKLSRGETVTAERRDRRKDGTLFWASNAFGPIHLEEGKPFWLGIVRDITERKLAEATLLRRNRELVLFNHASQAFTSTLDLSQVLATVLEEVRGVLNVAICSVWLFDPASGGLVCEEASGPKSELVRGWQLSLDQGVTGWVFQNRRPAIVKDTRTDERHFKGVDERTGWELRSILSVPLRIRERVIGTLDAADTEVDRFTPADLALVESLAATAAIAIENARLYDQARQDAETKAVLLREVNHRVKNNLSAIVGLLYAELRYGRAEDQTVMQDLIGRVQGMVTVHDMLSASEWSPLQLSALATEVIDASLQALPPGKSVSVDVSPSPVQVTPAQASSLALVIGELVANTIKHALTGRSKASVAVRITLEEDEVVLEYRDDGPGYPEEVRRLERRGVGLHLIGRLVDMNLRGEVAFGTDRGAVTLVHFGDGGRGDT